MGNKVKNMHEAVREKNKLMYRKEIEKAKEEEEAMG